MTTTRNRASAAYTCASGLLVVLFGGGGCSPTAPHDCPELDSIAFYYGKSLPAVDLATYGHVVVEADNVTRAQLDLKQALAEIDVRA